MELIDLIILFLIVSTATVSYVRLKRQMIKANAQNIGVLEKREHFQRIFEK